MYVPLVGLFFMTFRGRYKISENNQEVPYESQNHFGMQRMQAKKL